jgi:hypothetical protein
MTGRAVLSRNAVERLLRTGLNDQQIADWILEHEHEQVTRQAVSAARRRWGLEATRPTLRSVPWRLRPGDDTHELTRAVRSFARRQAGRELVPGDAKRLARVEAWLAERDGVLFYDEVVGWVVIRRRPGVDLGIIREPDVEGEGPARASANPT